MCHRQAGNYTICWAGKVNDTSSKVSEKEVVERKKDSFFVYIKPV
jgi:hypothetical protein